MRFEYAVELTGPLSAAHREELRQAASACPVHETLSKRIEFQAVQDPRSPAASGSHPVEHHI